MDSTIHLRPVIRVVHSLNRLIGILHAVRCTITIWLQRDSPPVARTYSIQMTYEAAFIALRKFQDLWKNHLAPLLDKDSQEYLDGESIMADCTERGLRKAANLIAAHYANERSEWPLSNREILDIIRSTRLDKEEDFVTWLDPIGKRMIAIRHEIMKRHDVSSLDEAIE